MTHLLSFKTILFSSVFAMSAAASAASLKLDKKCEQNITNVVYDKLGRFDDTFSVIGYKVIYQAMFTGLAVVRTSDEVEPSDVLVEFNETKNKDCEVTFKQILADGSVAEIDDELNKLNNTPRKIAKKYLNLQGQVLSIAKTEIGPESEEICLLTVDTKHGVFALVTDYYYCDSKQAVKVGMSANLSLNTDDNLSKTQTKEDDEVLNELKKKTLAHNFYRIAENEIK